MRVHAGLQMTIVLRLCQRRDPGLSDTPAVDWTGPLAAAQTSSPCHSTGFHTFDCTTEKETEVGFFRESILTKTVGVIYYNYQRTSTEFIHLSGLQLLK